MKITVGIACVPKRFEMAQQVKESLHEWLPLESVTVFVDKDLRGSWHGHKGAWLACHADSDFHLSLEDDVKVCKNFIPALEKVLTAVPDQVISLYATRTNYKKSEWAMKRNYSWYCDAYGASGQAVVMPTRLIIEFLKWELKCPPAMPYEDSRLWGWMYETGRYTWNTVPQFIEHLAPTDSSLGGFFNNEAKVAGCFADNIGIDPLTVDWNLGVEELRSDPRPKKYKWGEGTYMDWIGKHRRTE